MNDYIRLRGTDIVFLICLFLISASFIGPIYNFIAIKAGINPYVLNPLSTISYYLIIFFIYYLLILNPRKEKLRLNYSFKNFKFFPVVLFLFTGQFLLSEFLTGLIPTEGEFFGKLYKFMLESLVGNMYEYPFITFLLICVIAPIFEEIFFRGIILKGMLNNKVKPVNAVLISSLIFGGIHFFPWQVVGGFLMGMLLGLTFYKTGSLLTCTLLHFLNNFIAYLLFMKYESLEISELSFNGFILLPLGIILVWLFGKTYLKITKNTPWISY